MTVPSVRQPNIEPGLQDQTSIALNLHHFTNNNQPGRTRTIMGCY
jgi:hypothetical protein